MSTNIFQGIIDRFIQWAGSEENIRLAVIVGSQARLDPPADAWSDLDIIFLSHNPEVYGRGARWIEQIGEVWLDFSEQTPDGRNLEHRVLYAGGLDVDFVPMAVAPFQQILEHGMPPDLADMLRRGVRLLVDKDGLGERLTTLHVPPAEQVPPAKAEFLNLVNDFWYHTVWTAKHLRRGELWWAKGCADGYLKDLLRRMMEWHAQVMRPGTDTWMRGRFLEDWVDIRAISALPEIFAHYDQEDIWRALTATMDLFRWLAVETAEKLGYPYPSKGDEHASELVQRLYEQAFEKK